MVCALYPLKKVRGVKDSKLLTHKQRLKLFEKLQYNSIYTIAPATVNSINGVGIYKARNYAIASALESLYLQLLEMNIKPEKAVIDGPFSKEWMNYFRSKVSIPVECMVDADSKVYAVSAASTVGKIYMDSLFEGFGKFFPGYGFEHDHGSPSENHIEVLRKNGPSPYHRTKNYAAKWWEKIRGKTK